MSGLVAATESTTLEARIRAGLRSDFAVRFARSRNATVGAGIVGAFLVVAIFARDYPVTLAIVVLFTLFYAGINLVVDLLYGLVDPRIRLGRAAS